MGEMETLLRWVLPVYMVFYIGVAFLWRSYLIWKRTGINPYALGKRDTAHDFIGALLRLALSVDVIVILLYTLWQEAYVYLTPISWLVSPVITLVGLISLIGSVLWVSIAQAQMGDAWRIGIDEAQKTQLVEHGLFGLSRNPIFLGMRFTILGLFLVLPNAVTLATWALGDALIQIQTRLEEEHLLKNFGERYQGYCQRTRRWL